jgi:CelD/BcsL family acetyltransferase involved in cellulose biosynthesis
MSRQAPVPEIETRLLESNDDLTAIRSDWQRLHRACPGGTLANSWEWMSTWWDVYRRPGWRLFVVLFFHGDKIVGIAPLYRKSRLLYGELWMLGSGEGEADEVVSEYPDFIIDPAYEDAIGRLAWSQLEDLGRWSLMRLDNVFQTSIVAKLRSRRVMAQPAGFRHRIRLPGTWTEFLAGRSSNMRRKFVQARKDGERANVEESVAQNQDAAGQRAFDQLVSLHGARWQSRGKSGAFESEYFCRFHRELLRRHASALGAEIRVLSSGDKPFSAIYNFCFGDTVYFYQSGFSDCAQVRSPGILAHGLAIEQAISANMGYYDFMRGEAGGYKSRFGCETTEMAYITHYRSGALASIVYLKDRLIDRMRRFRQHLAASVHFASVSPEH